MKYAFPVPCESTPPLMFCMFWRLAYLHGYTNRLLNEDDDAGRDLLSELIRLEFEVRR